MGRGLSSLQKQILMIGGNETKAALRHKNDAHLSTSVFQVIPDDQDKTMSDSLIPCNHYRVSAIEVFSAYYSIPLCTDLPTGKLRLDSEPTSSQYAAVSKAFQRLYKRGLLRAKRANGEWPLTHKGLQWVASNG